MSMFILCGMRGDLYKFGDDLTITIITIGKGEVTLELRSEKEIPFHHYRFAASHDELVIKELTFLLKRNESVHFGDCSIETVGFEKKRVRLSFKIPKKMNFQRLNEESAQANQAK